jgi:hypothetical protein
MRIWPRVSRRFAFHISLFALSLCLSALSLCLVAPFLMPGAAAGASELSSDQLSPAALDQLRPFTEVAETDYLSLFINEATTEIAVFDKRTGRVWYSNQVDRASDPLAKGTAKDSLNAQIEISYFMPNDEQRFMNSYSHSVVNGQYRVSPIDNGVRVEYTFGTKWKDSDYLPIMISKERMEEKILKNIQNEKDRQFLVSKYDLISLERITDPDYKHVAVSNLDLNEVFGDYKLTTEKPLSASDLAKLVGHLADTIVESRKLVDITERRYLKFEHFSQLVESQVYLRKRSVMAWDVEDMIKIVRQAGYTPEDRQIDDIANSLWPVSPSYEVFKVAVEYTLEGDSLLVRVPADGLAYPVKQPTTYKSSGGRITVDEEGRPVFDERGPTATMPLHSVALLRYFGAANQQKSGYMLVPDGSGALIDLNNGKTYASPYSSPVYGVDSSASTRDPLARQVHLPVFGMKQDDAAFFAVVEEGDAIATIRADVSGRSSMYNCVWAEFVIIPFAVALRQVMEDEIATSSKTGINVYQVRPASTDVAVRYVLLSGDDSTYAGMARYYQGYLERKHGLSQFADSNLPFFLEILGAIDVRRPILGISRDVVEPLTTIEEATEMVDTLVTGGVQSLSIVYTGWSEGGLNHYFPTTLKVERAIGTSEEFGRFLDYADQIGARVYPSLSLLNVHRTKLFDGFSPRRDAARNLLRKTATIARQEPSGYLRSGETPTGYVVSPWRLGPLVNRLIPQLGGLDVDRICLLNIGQQVNSDFRDREETLIDKQHAADLQEAALAALSQSGIDLMVRGGNEYAIPFASAIIDMPDTSTRYRIVDRSVPFLQMVLHGYVDYASAPLNLSDNYREALLRSIEYGAAPYFQWMFREPEVIKGTNYDYLHSANYKSWIGHAIDFYNEINEAVGHLRNQRIVDHRKVADGVYVVRYEDGTSVFVNYGDEAVDVSQAIQNAGVVSADGGAASNDGGSVSDDGDSVSDHGDSVSDHSDSVSSGGDPVIVEGMSYAVHKGGAVYGER